MRWICAIISYFVLFDVAPHFWAWHEWRKTISQVSLSHPPDGDERKSNSESDKPDSVRLCSITFDDGPDPVFTQKILDILKDYSVKCTFFMMGKKCVRYPELVRRIVSEGHVVGIHGWDHCHPWLQNPLTLYRKIGRAQKVIEDAADSPHTKVAFFRPPWGFWTLWNLILARRYIPVLWSVPGRDWVRGATPREVAENVLSGLKPNAVILIHDGGSYSGVTVEALPLILEGLKEKNYLPVPVNSLPSITNFLKRWA